jgi:hypothetical protein
MPLGYLEIDILLIVLIFKIVFLGVGKFIIIEYTAIGCLDRCLNLDSVSDPLC